MEELIVFVHRQGSRKMTEIAVIEAMTVAELLEHASSEGQPLPGEPEEILVFFGEAEEPARRDACQSARKRDPRSACKRDPFLSVAGLCRWVHRRDVRAAECPSRG